MSERTVSPDMSRGKRKKYWYKHFITECPICGRGEHRRERQYTSPPPKDSPDRWDYNGLAYDWCNAL